MMKTAEFKKLILILGGSRSGKSSFAERLASENGKGVIYLATGKAVDGEMKMRIRCHQKMRPAGWRTIEVNGDLPEILLNGLLHENQNIDDSGDNKAGDSVTVIVDCLTIYVAELLDTYKLSETKVMTQFKNMLRQVKKPANIIMVSNEVGMGLVPPYPLGRKYRDVLGKVNQLVAKAADEVFMMVAGIPVKIKDSVERRG